jgi:hypothetical protein
MTAFQGPPPHSRRALREEQRRERPRMEEFDDSQIAADVRPSGRRASAIVTDGVVNFVEPEPTDVTADVDRSGSALLLSPEPIGAALYNRATGAVPTSSIPFIMTTTTPRDSSTVVTPAETFVSPYSRRASTPEQTVDAPAAEETPMDQTPTSGVADDADNTPPAAVTVGDPIEVTAVAPVNPITVPGEERSLTRRELRALRAAAEAAAAAEAGGSPSEGSANTNATEAELAAAEQAAADERKAARLEAARLRAAPLEAADAGPGNEAGTSTDADTDTSPDTEPPATEPPATELPATEQPVEQPAPMKWSKRGRARERAAQAEAEKVALAEAEVAALAEAEAEKLARADAENAASVSTERTDGAIPPLVEPAVTPAPALSNAMAEFEALTHGSHMTDSAADFAFPVRLEPEASDDETLTDETLAADKLAADKLAADKLEEADLFTNAEVEPAEIEHAEVEPGEVERADVGPADIEPAAIHSLDEYRADDADDTSAPTTYVPPIGHWSLQADIDDESQPPENTISREVGGGNNSMSTNALVLPLSPQRDDFSSVLSATGEILITGTINLPGSVGATGRDSRHYDDPEVDHLFDSYDQELPITDSAPVRAITAVSSHTATRGGIESSGKHSNRMLTVLLVSASGMAAVVLGLLVTGFVLNIF